MSVLRLSALFLLGLAAVALALVPLAPGGGLVPPDLLFCLVLAWVLRAPEPVPVWALVVLGLFADAMLSRPMGLGALGLLLAAEAVSQLAPRLRGAHFVLEWLVAGVLFALVLAGTQLAMRVVFADAPPVGDLLRYVAATVIAYPVVALAVALALRPARRRVA